MKRILRWIVCLAVSAVLMTGSMAITASAATYGNYQYEVLSDGTVEIWRYTGSEFAVNIPSAIDGKTVSSIGSDAFRGRISLESVTIPDSVTSIGEYAFSGCISLKRVTIPNSLTEIGYQAFFDCDSLKTVNYSGSEGEWTQVKIGERNSNLLHAELMVAADLSWLWYVLGGVVAVAAVAAAVAVVIILVRKMRASQPVCSACGKRNPKGNAFCEECGTKL